MDKDIKVTLKVWRQRGPKEKGQFETYPMEIHQSVSFLEMLDNLRLTRWKSTRAFLSWKCWIS